MNLVLFDFDGTISTKDSLNLFFKYIEPLIFKRFYLKYIETFPQLIFYKLGIISSEKLKKARISVFFKGKTYSQLKTAGIYFSNNILPSVVKKSACDTINLHLSNGDNVFIVSASLDIILESWCNQRGIVLITNNINQNTLCYDGADCNGIEKVIRIKQQIELSRYDLIYAYGDTNGDKPMLNLAHKSFYQYFK